MQTPTSSSEAWNIYRQNAQGGLSQWLEKRYPRVLTLVGDECFHQLATTFCQSNLPNSSQVEDYGQAFPLFLASLSETNANLSELPYLAEVAQLDNVCYQSYYATNRTPWPQQHFLALTPEAQANCRFFLAQDVYLLQSEWDLLLLTQDNNTTLTLNEIMQTHQYVVSRSSLTVNIQEVEPQDFALLNHIVQGRTLNEIAEHSSALLPRFTHLLNIGWISHFREQGLCDS
nr:DNA-binding domain-containing protein [Pleionea sp. CnH1-48]